MATYARFSSPGKQGFVPGTSKKQYRSDWIEIGSFSYSKVTNEDIKTGDKIGDLPLITRKIPTVNLTHLSDKSSPILKRLTDQNTLIDQIVIEMDDKQGMLTYAMVMKNANILSITYSNQSVNTIVEEIRLYFVEYWSTFFHGNQKDLQQDLWMYANYLSG